MCHCIYRVTGCSGLVDRKEGGVSLDILGAWPLRVSR